MLINVSTIDRNTFSATFTDFPITFKFPTILGFSGGWPPWTSHTSLWRRDFPGIWLPQYHNQTPNNQEEIWQKTRNN